MDVDCRRSEMLRLEGLGFSQAVIVKELSQKVGCSKNTIYNDFETRTSWQLILQGMKKPDDVLLKVTNRNEQIYRQASILCLTSQNQCVKIAALKIMLEVNSIQLENIVLAEMKDRLKTLEEKAKRGVFVP